MLKMSISLRFTNFYNRKMKAYTMATSDLLE